MINIENTLGTCLMCSTWQIKALLGWIILILKVPGHKWQLRDSCEYASSNPGKHGSPCRIREKSILTTFKWKVCVLNDIQLKWYLHHCVGLKLNFQVIYLFWCLAPPVRWFWDVFSSPEPKARVSYCHSASSVVRPSSVRRLSVVRRP